MSLDNGALNTNTGPLLNYNVGTADQTRMHHCHFRIHFVIKCFPYRVPTPCELGILGPCWPGNLAAAAVAAAPDGSTPPSQSVAETVKLLKRLGYPDTQEVRTSSSLLTKINQSITKRMGKLEETSQLLSKPGTAESQLTKKNLGSSVWTIFRIVKGWSLKWQDFNLFFIGSLSNPIRTSFFSLGL